MGRPLSTRATRSAPKVASRGQRRAAPAVWGHLSEGDLVVVDTAPLIYLLEDHPEFAPRFEGLFELHRDGVVQIAISSIALAEVLAGPFKQGQDVLAMRYETELSGFEVQPVTQAIAVAAARLRTLGGLRLPDAIHAATAIELGAVALVTHDRDFSRLQGLRIVTGPD